MAGLAGRDDYGEFMIRGLGELGVKTDLVKRTDRVRTGVTVNLLAGTATGIGTTVAAASAFATACATATLCFSRNDTQSCRFGVA